MTSLHDPAVRDRLRARVQSLSADAPRQWGVMSVDQMLWHVNILLAAANGEERCAPTKVPLPVPVMRFLVLNLPWPKNAPTMPEAIARERFDLETERARCLTLIDAVAARDLDGEWPLHPAFGRMTGNQWSALQAKHLDHHLRQFGA